ncbi:hypothetical protein [Blastopirellula marina]|uniref:Tetratricopeptide repeat-containing protein n=1 Tax=Blastopirellula marina TaxID=124 RepID=A0A2S8G6E5_9BACT|nr:hypothetical protein [Blastopirellula marina]PQO39973.1 hypothetical protein C5Y98_06545 [Blastopirellula marina]PTL45348.1 hypothetical protein C5Y97_06545 [Blastopirellula marina]
MNNSLENQIHALWDEAFSLPYGEVQVNLLEQAIPLAEELRDLDVNFHARFLVLQTGFFGGHAEKSLTQFAWCLAQYERDPVRFEQYYNSLLVNFPNVLVCVDEFPQINMRQIESLRSQMTTHFRQNGLSLRSLYSTTLLFATRAGDLATAAETLPLYRNAPHDQAPHTRAAEIDREIEYYDLIGDMETAIETAGPNLRRELSAAEVPHRVMAYVLRPLATLSRYDEADDYQRRGYRLIRNNPTFLLHFGLHMSYLVHRGRIDEAMRIFERHLSAALETRLLRSQYLFYLGARRALTAAAERTDVWKLNLPRTFPAYDESGRYDLAELIAWIDGVIQPLGARFDQRNGVQYFTQRLIERMSY